MGQVWHAHMRPISALMMAMLFAFMAMAEPAAACTPERGVQTMLYAPFEVQVANPRPVENPFDYKEIALEAVVSAPDGRTFELSGFYDGVTGEGRVNTWKLRILADHPGVWRYAYRWSGGPTEGGGCFAVGDESTAALPGPVKVDPANPRYLVHDDGTPHYWWGGRWLGATDYGPAQKGGQWNPDWHSDVRILAYLDLLERYDHNGILVKIALGPLENDKLSWDLPWIRRAEWLVQEAAKRGIYVQLNFFDTWARDRDEWFDWNIEGEEQVFNVWRDDDLPAIENYIRSLVARFSGYANVYWELGNEMEHQPNSGNAFAALAERYYLPWIRQYDPYDRPVALSEEVWRCTSADIALLHQTYKMRDALERASFFALLRKKVRMLGKRLTRGCWRLGPQQRPEILNELVRGGDTGPLWQDSVMRDPASRFSYRRAFWQHFVRGGSGSSEATYLDTRQPPNDAVLNVMADHQRLRHFIEALPVSINEMAAVQDWVTGGPPQTDYSRTRLKEGAVYVTYLRSTGPRPAGRVTLSQLPAGSYEARWIDPSSGRTKRLTSGISGASGIELDHPAFVDDLVLLVTERSILPDSPRQFVADVTEGD